MKRHAGFTVVEVMVSLGVMTVGAFAILAMEQQTTRANVHARELTVATQIAQTWIERLKIDAVRWSATSGVSNVGADLGATSYLQDITKPASEGVFLTIPTPGGSPGVPNLPPATPSMLYSSAFDYYGNEVNMVSLGGAVVVYCASYRLSWIYIDRLIRADVRVWWPREGTNTFTTDYPNCQAHPENFLPSTGNPAGVAPARYHVVYLSTSIRNLQYQ
ncbi:MAG TPA: prepilin-type N-terminal cleavage/methylation domain-containing protein [Polyangiales bacterium]